MSEITILKILIFFKISAIFLIIQIKFKFYGKINLLKLKFNNEIGYFNCSTYKLSL